MMTKKNLIETIACMCHYATEHTDGWEVDGTPDFEDLFQCTSYTVACFLAQNTKYGSEGVEWYVIMGSLCERPVKTIEEWRVIASNLVEYFSKEHPSDQLEKIVCDYAEMRWRKKESPR